MIIINQLNNRNYECRNCKQNYFYRSVINAHYVTGGFDSFNPSKKKMKRRFYEAIKTLEKYPNITLKEGEREYSVYFICKSEKAYLNRLKETSGEWGAFCEVDKRTMRQLIACNPHMEVMNIPVEDLYFECFYKIVRVK